MFGPKYLCEQQNRALGVNLLLQSRYVRNETKRKHFYRGSTWQGRLVPYYIIEVISYLNDLTYFCSCPLSEFVVLLVIGWSWNKPYGLTEPIFQIYNSGPILIRLLFICYSFYLSLAALSLLAHSFDFFNISNTLWLPLIWNSH